MHTIAALQNEYENVTVHGLTEKEKKRNTSPCVSRIFDNMITSVLTSQVYVLGVGRSTGIPVEQRPVVFSDASAVLVSTR